MSANRLTETLTALADAGVRFVVCGGVACVLQGVSRATQDLDLRVAMDDENLRRLLAAVERLGLRPRIPEPAEALLDPDRRRAWVEEKHAVVYTFVDVGSPFSVDVFLRYPIALPELVSAADTFGVEGRSIRVSSKQHLIEAKQAVQPPRRVDLRDIEDLKELLHAG